MDILVLYFSKQPYVCLLKELMGRFFDQQKGEVASRDPPTARPETLAVR